MRTDDSGMALVGVIGVMIVGLLLTALIMSSVTTGYGFTTNSRARVQSQASADAGVAVARAAIERDACSAVGGHFYSAPGVEPAYDVQVWSRTSTTGAWTSGCPGGSAIEYKVIGSADAQSAAVAGASVADDSTVDARFSAPVTTTTVVSSGQAVYAYGNATATGAGLVTSVSGSSASVYVKNGSLVCNGGAGIAGDVVVPDGNVTISGSCKVGGSIYTSGWVDMEGSTSGNKVTGSVVAKWVNFHSASSPIGGSVWTTSATDASSITSTGPIAGGVYTLGALTLKDSPVGGNVIVGGTLNLFSTVGGSVVASSISMTSSGSGNVAGSAYAPNGTVTLEWGRKVSGNVVAKNIVITDDSNAIGQKAYASANVTLNSSAGYQIYALTKSGSGTATPSVVTGWTGTPVAPSAPTAPALPTVPTVPQWIDYTYDSTNWSGYTTIVLSGSSCNTKEVYTALQTIGSSKGIIDARLCTGTVDLTSGFNMPAPSYAWVEPNFVLKNDLLILSKKFKQDNGKWNSFTTAQHNLWLVQEDLNANHLPDCAGQSMSIGGGGLQVDSLIKLMVYTPCAVTVTSSQAYNGQVYAGGGTTLSGSGTLTFYQVGLPGADLDGGTSSAPSTAPRTWSFDSVRTNSGD